MERLDIIGVPILTQGSKLVKHLQTIDVPLKRYYILDNSMGLDPSVEEGIDWVCENKPDHIREIVVVQNNQNAGYPGSVNQIIRDNTDCRHWIVTGFDWWVKPGQLSELLYKVNSLPNGAFLGENETDCMCGFMWTPRLLENVGYLDENFFPGYFEDNDYRYRIKQSGLHVMKIPMSADHDRSSTLRSKPEFQRKNQFTFQKNYQYYVEKWGGPPGSETFDKPWDKHGIEYWHFDPTRRQKLRWH